MTISRTPLLLAGLAALGFTGAALAQQQSNPKMDVIKGTAPGILLWGKRPADPKESGPAQNPADAPAGTAAAAPAGHTAAPAGTWGALAPQSAQPAQAGSKVADTSERGLLDRLNIFKPLEPPKGQSINQLKKSLDTDETGIALPTGAKPNGK